MVQKKKSPAGAVGGDTRRPVKAAASAPGQTEPPPPKKRGRPRAYQPEVALAQAMDVFWKDGFAATSLDSLSAATGMNRPSLYGAFGDKRDIYMKAYKHYGERARQRMAGIFAADLPLRALLRSVYGLAIEMYLSGEDGPRGCFTVMTATSEAVFDPQLRGMVQTSLTEMDRFFARLFEAAMVKGELPKSANSETLAQLATATIHTIAVRARAGVPKKDLEAIANGAIGLICGPDNDRVRDKRQKR